MIKFLKYSLLTISLSFLLIYLVYVLYVILFEKKLIVTKKDGKCSLEKVLSLEDSFKVAYAQGREIGSTEVEIWFSECESMEIKSCSSPFNKLKIETFPNWKGFEQKEFTPVKLLFKKGFYGISIFVNNEIKISDTIWVRDCE